MEANDLYSVSISPVVTNSFALEWSQDNHVSLITHRGVHVFELVPHPMCISPTFRFWRSFIHSSEYAPARRFEKLIDKALWKMDREDVYALLMQPSLTPNIEDRTNIDPRIIRVAWSPLQMAAASKCLLAILTSAGSAEILHKYGNDWLSVWNLSHRQYEMVKEDSNLDPENITDKKFSKIAWPEHVNRFLCTAIAWSPPFRSDDDSTFAYIVAVFRSCDLVVFRVERVSDLSSVVEPTVAYKTKLPGGARICELLWVSLGTDKHAIVMAYADGRIQGLRVKVSDGIFGEETLFKYHDHADRIVPSSIKLMNQNDGRRIVLVTKSFWVLALSVDDNGECLKTRCLRVGDAFITGMTLVGSDSVILTTQTSQIYSIAINNDEELSCEIVKNNLKSKKVRYLGIAHSPNATIFVNVTSPDALHDHLINREPSTLQIFNFTGDRWNPWKIIKIIDNEKTSLHEYWDCLESLRVRSARSIEPHEKYPKIPQDLENLSINNLRTVMWLTVMSQVSEKKEMLKGVDKIVGELSEAQPLIFLLSACDHLRLLSMKKNLTVDDKRCGNFLRMYLEIYIAGDDDEDDETMATSPNEISRRVNEALDLTSNLNSTEIEACNLCDEIITDLPWTIDSCPAGHKLSRCSLTLLQITSVRYRICPICDRLYHPSLDDDYPEIRCIYCDVPAQYDCRVNNSSHDDVNKLWINLSERRTSNLESKIQDNENYVDGAASFGEKMKKRGMNPQTFAVIVNKEEDDSFITETWQKF